MKHFQKAYLRPFPGLIVLTSLYLANIQPKFILHPTSLVLAWTGAPARTGEVELL